MQLLSGSDPVSWFIALVFAAFIATSVRLVWREFLTRLGVEVGEDEWDRG